MSSRDRIAAAAEANGWYIGGGSGTRFVSYTKCATQLTVSYTRADQVSWARAAGFRVSTRRGAGKAEQVIDHLESDLLADGPCTLLGMSPAGELVIVRDGIGDVWLVSIYAPDKRVTAGALTQFVARGAVCPVEQPFDNWSQLDAYRRANIRPPSPRFPAYADYTTADVHAAMQDTENAEDPDEIALAQTILEHVVEQTLIVRRDTDLRELVARRISELQQGVATR